MLKNLKFKIINFKFFIFLCFVFCVMFCASAYAVAEQIAVSDASDNDVATTESAGTVSDETQGSQDTNLKDKGGAPEETTAVSSLAATASSSEGSGGSAISDLIKSLQISPAGNSGSAATSIPIVAPPGRKGITPNLSLNYNSSSVPNGWLGVGWSLDIGAIQRNTKRGVNYSANDYVVTVNGSSSELVSRGDWGTNYYGSKTEGTFSKYYYNFSTGGWEVTTKDGSKYYYGTTAASRQDNANGVFKWCMDKVQDTNGNYMTVTYWKEQGEIYLDRIDYTGNTAGLSPTNYLKFIRDDGSRTDAPIMYNTHASVKTAYRLKTIEVYGNGLMARKYELSYSYSNSTLRSLLSSVTLYGSDGLTAFRPVNFTYSAVEQGFNSTAIQWNTPVTYSGWYQYVRNSNSTGTYQDIIDMNGDGLPDRVTNNTSSSGNYLMVYLNTGSGFSNTAIQWNTPVTYSGWYQYVRNINSTGAYQDIIDMNGDGLPDRVTNNTSSSGNYLMVYSSGGLTDRLITVDNGIDGTTALSYNPSTQYTNNYLPFVIQTLSSVTVNDGSGVSSTTNYTYSGGFYDYEDREFRGFQYVQATDPINTTTETWFKQDDIFKGLAYEQIIKDSADNIYTRTYNTYQSTSPYTGVNFPYLSLKVDYVYDGKATAKQAVTSYFYDSYGNITRKYLFGDISLSGDERDEYTEYQYDTLNWIVSLPSTTYVKDNAGITKAQAWFTYDAKGNLLTKTVWLNGDINPVIRYTYDPYGNQASIEDARNNTTTIAYDSTYTYPATIQNPLGHTINKTYDYKFGKPLTETDPNNNTTTYQYDVFGRLTKVTNPNDTTSTYGTVSYYYLNFGIIGSQRIVTYATEQSGTGNYIWSETYFDGLGRTIKTRSEGPVIKVVAHRTLYDNRGHVSYASLPYFEGIVDILRVRPDRQG